MKHVMTLLELSSGEFDEVFDTARQLKDAWSRGERPSLLKNRVMGLLFEKPSLRTRVSFEAAMAHLGGRSLFLGPDVGWGQREPIGDFSRVLSSYVDVIVCRANSHQRISELADHAQCPVINGLTDFAHPCQALADLFTMSELFGSLDNRALTFVGDGNNVARSLAVACGRVGVRFTLAGPTPYQFDSAFLRQLEQRVPELTLVQTADVAAAVSTADVVYTDVWTSMGQEPQQRERAAAFQPYQVNAALMAQAPSHAKFMHCLPARRDEEVTDEVIDGSQSAVIGQAENRMHAQKALLVWLLAKND